MALVIIGLVVFFGGLASLLYGISLNRNVEVIMEYLFETGRTDPGQKWVIIGAVLLCVGGIMAILALLGRRKASGREKSEPIRRGGKLCPHCGKPLSGSPAFCPACGKSISVDPPEDKILCPHCGKSVPKTANNCPYCGGAMKDTPVPEKKTCPHCGKELVGSPAFCPYCGGSTREEDREDTVFCPQCGRSVPKTANNCPYCGRNMHVDEEPALCPRCGKPLPADGICPCTKSDSGGWIIPDDLD